MNDIKQSGETAVRPLDIAAEKLKLSQARSERAERYLALAEAKEQRLAARRAQLAEPVVAPPRRPSGRQKDMSDEAIDRRCLERSIKINKLKAKLADSVRGLNDTRGCIVMWEQSLAKAQSDPSLPDTEEGKQRVLNYRANLPDQIARSKAVIPEYETDIQLFTDTIKQLERENDDEKAFRVGAL